MKASDFVFGFDIETLGFSDNILVGSLVAEGPFKPQVASIGLSHVSTGNVGFLGRTGKGAFDVERFLSIGGERTHKFKLLPGKITEYDPIAEQLRNIGYTSRDGSDVFLTMSERQLKYVKGTIPRGPEGNFVSKYIDPTIKEIAEKGGGVYGSEKSLLGGFKNRLEDILSQTQGTGVKPTLVGHNISGFDIKHLKDTPLEKVLSKFDIVDTGTQSQKVLSEMYSNASEAVRGTSLSQEWTSTGKYKSGWSLDVMLSAYGAEGRASAAKHGVFEDTLEASKLAKLISEKANITPESHARAMITHGNERQQILGQEVLDALGMPQQAAAAEATAAAAAAPAPSKHVPLTETRLTKMMDNMPKMQALFDKAVSNKMGIAIGAVMAGATWFALSGNEDAQAGRSTVRSLFDSITSLGAQRSEYVTSSMLGMTNTMDILGRIYDPAMSDIGETVGSINKREGIFASGNQIHENIQQGLMSSGVASGSEVYVEDPTNKVFGYIDIMLQGGTPLEIKSIGGSAFKKLNTPKEQHISQANFYALAKESSTAMIMYVSREDPSQRKMFTISADPGRYAADIETLRNVQRSVSKLPSKSKFYSNYRPLNSWFGGGINYNIPNSNRARVSDQRATLSTLPVSMNMAQQRHYNHPNQSRQGI